MEIPDLFDADRVREEARSYRRNLDDSRYLLEGAVR
jgi:hypothetical protein